MRRYNIKNNSLTDSGLLAIVRLNAGVEWWSCRWQHCHARHWSTCHYSSRLQRQQITLSIHRLL